MRLRRTALRAYPLMNTYARPADGAKDQKPKQDQKPDQEPLTLALSRRERGLTELYWLIYINVRYRVELRL